MNERCADLAQPVLSYGLDLLSRLQSGTSADLAAEQATLKDMLLLDERADRNDPDDETGFEGVVAMRTNKSRFLGVRYALVCWLDELFTTRGPWAEEWNEHKLEVELYGSNDRAWKFWEQAKLAQNRATTDALEVYYLCVTLGFRGALGQKAGELTTWLNSARQRLGHVSEPDWPLGGESSAVNVAPPLRGASKLRQMALTTWVAVLIAAPLAAYVVVHRLSR
jgi:type VI secretion system protein ImpK